MNWFVLIDNPASIGLLVGVSSMLVLTAGVFIGRAWGVERGPEILKRELANERRKTRNLTNQNAQLQITNADLGDKVRSMRGYARRVSDRFDELADQSTEFERTRKRQAG